MYFIVFIHFKMILCTVHSLNYKQTNKTLFDESFHVEIRNVHLLHKETNL